MKYFPISDSSLAAVGAISDAQKATKRGYLEARAIYQDPTKLKYALGNLTAAGVADDYMVSTPGKICKRQPVEHRWPLADLLMTLLTL